MLGREWNDAVGVVVGGECEKRDEGERISDGRE